MAQTGYTPILIYSSSTASNLPSASNLTNSTLGSELAINIADGKLFYKDTSNAVQVIAWKVTPTTAGGTGLTSYTAGDMLYYASGATLSKLAIGASKTIMTSSGTAPQWSASLDTSQGGTGVTSYTAGDLPYYASGTAYSKLGIGAANTVLTSSGSAPQWTAQSNLSVGTASNLKSNATTGVMQIVGPAAASTRVMTIPDANFTAARTDAGQTFTGVQTFTSPKIITDISDTNGNELFKLTATSSAVNEFTVANAATGSGPTLSATGSDTNINMNITPKGTGDVVVGSQAVNVVDNQVLTSNTEFLQYVSKACSTGAVTNLFSFEIRAAAGGNQPYTKGMFRVQVAVDGDNSHEGGGFQEVLICYINGDSYAGASANVTVNCSINYSVTKTITVSVSGRVVTVAIDMSAYAPNHNKQVNCYIYNKDKTLTVTAL